VKVNSVMISIIPLKTGSIYCDKGKTLTTNVDAGKMGNIPAIAWLIQTPTEKILVDTGMPETKIASEKHYLGSSQLPGERIDQALHLHHIRPEEITTVIFTHLHWDHCQNGHFFPNAKFYVQKKELEFARTPIGTYFRSYDHPGIGLAPSFEKYPLTIVDGDAQIAPGVRVILTPGHSPGHQIVVVDTASGPYVIAGDAVLCYENLIPGVDGDFILPGRHKDTPETIAAIRTILSLAGEPSRVLPGHDEKVFRKKVYD